MQFWHVHIKDTNLHWFGTGFNRESVKENAHKWFGMGNPDEYIVTPLTNPGERFKLEAFYV